MTDMGKTWWHMLIKAAKTDGTKVTIKHGDLGRVGTKYVSRFQIEDEEPFENAVEVAFADASGEPVNFRSTEDYLAIEAHGINLLTIDF